MVAPELCQKHRILLIAYGGAGRRNLLNNGKGIGGESITDVGVEFKIIYLEEIRLMRSGRHYSCRRASVGVSLAALYAESTPKISR